MYIDKPHLRRPDTQGLLKHGDLPIDQVQVRARHQPDDRQQLG
jgi:hypothetical protein